MLPALRGARLFAAAGVHSKVLNHHRWPVRKLSHEFQRAAHAFHIVAQCGQQHVAAYFQSRDCVLPNAQRDSQLRLSVLFGLPQVFQRGQFHGARCHPLLAFFRQRGHHLSEFSCMIGLLLQSLCQAADLPIRVGKSDYSGERLTNC